MPSDQRPSSLATVYRLLALSLIGGFFVVGLGTPPLLPPVHRYAVDGNLVRTGGNVAGYAVVLLGRLPGDTALHVLRGISSADVVLDISGADGHFFLTVSTPVRADSLAVAAFRADRPTGVGMPFAVDSSSAAEVREVVHSYNEPGCGDCGTGGDTYERIAAYRYSFFSVSVVLP